MKSKAVFGLLLMCAFKIFAEGSYTLQDFYSQPSVKMQFDDVMRRLDMADSTMKYSYKVQGNTMIYIYELAEQQNDVEAFREALISRFRNSVINFVIESLEKESGVNDVRVQYIYYNKDGSEIYNQIWMK